MTAAEKWYVIVMSLFVTLCHYVVSIVTVCAITLSVVSSCFLVLVLSVSHMMSHRHDISGKKDLGELTWEQREHVLRLLFSKMNSQPLENSKTS